MRRRVFQGYGPEVDAKYQRAGYWLRATIFEDTTAREWCAKNGVALRKAVGEGIGTAGAFLVPTELANAILDARDVFGAFRRRALIVPMSSDSTVTPKRPGSTSAFFIGENTTVTNGNVNVSAVQLTAKKIGSLMLLSSEVEEDSMPGMVDFIANEIGWSFGVTEDSCAFNGDGTSTYGGMRGLGTAVLDGNHGIAKVVAATGHNTFLTLDATDVANLISAVQAAAIPNAAWFVSQTGFAQTFCRLAGAAGGAYMYVGEVDGIATPFYLGFPVILTQALPLISTSLTGKMMLGFGDMYLGAVLGERRGITLARSPDRYLDIDQIAIRGTERFDAVLHHLGDNTTAGALAALVAP